jgi:hypothetical protein
VKNSLLRRAGHSVLRDHGFNVRVKSGQGYLPGTRVVLVKDGKKTQAAVKASQERALSFTRQSNDLWRTLHAVGLVVVVVPGENDPDEADVLAFEKRALVRVFDRAWKALGTAKRPIGFNMPVFVPLDEVSRKNVGHDVGNLKKLAIWSVHLTAAQLATRTSDTIEGDYVDQFRRKYAAEHGVDISQVKISVVRRSNDE